RHSIPRRNWVGKKTDQFFDAVPAGKFVEVLAWAALRQIRLQHRSDALRHFLRRNRTADFATELGIGATAAADHDVIALDLFVLALLDLCREQTDIADIVLSTGIGTASQMNVDRLAERQPCIEMIDQYERVALRVAERELAAE